MNLVTLKVWRTAALFAGLTTIWVASAALAQSYVNFEGKQTNPVRLSPDGTRLFAVNTPDGKLSVFDITHPSNPFLIAEIPVGVEPVSVNALNNDEAWVVNEVSDSVSVVSVSRRMITDTIQAKDEPADVVFAGDKAFVSVSRRNEVHVFDATNHTRLAVIPLFGENPRAMAVNSNGTSVYVAFALSGNHTTIVPPTNAPPQSPPTNTNLPAPPQVGLIIDATNSTYYPSLIQYNMPDNDVAEIDTGTLTLTRYFSHVGTINLGIAVRPDDGEIYVANTEALNLVHFETNLRGHFVDNRIARIYPADGSITNYDLNPGIDYNVLPNLAAKSNALSQPTAIAFDGSGSNLYVASFGTDRIAKVDPDGNILARIEVGPPTESGSQIDSRSMRGPRGLAMNAAAERLYVLNRIANTLTVIDTASDSVLKEIPIGSFDPTPSAIRQGRGFLYDAKQSGNGTASCAACHIDSDMDMLAWDLGNPGGEMFTNGPNATVYHPMKGPMVTQTLRGLDTLEPFHWRGDRTNFLHFAGTFDELMGGTALNLSDMQAFRDFINTVRFQPNPNELLDRTLPATFAGGSPTNGRDTMSVLVGSGIGKAGCPLCHSVNPPGTVKDIIPGATTRTSQDFKIPHLRNLYQKTSFNNTPGTNSIGGFGYRNDGVFGGLFQFLSQPFFAFANSGNTKTNLRAFLLCFDTGTAPAVGYTRTLFATNVSDPGVTSEWSILESQAAAANIDLVVKGTIDGVPHGLLYAPTPNLYLLDTGNNVMLHAQVVAKIQAGDTVTLIGVPPGSGTRLGIDRNLNGVPDADEPPPTLQSFLANDDFVIQWPFTAVGFALESADFPGGPWSTEDPPVEIVANNNYVTNTPSSDAKFFRLRAAAP